jgi:hypothetical protein
MELKENALQFAIASVDESRRLVFGQVYQPNKIDAKGWFMDPDEVEKMAHRYMRLANLRDTIDTNHDNIPNGCYPVQSFIARAGDPEYAEGSWVLGVKITSDELWNQIVQGDINAFSMEIYVRRVPALVTYELTPNQLGQTEPAADGHVHYFFSQIDDSGRVIKGRTTTNAGHFHEIELNSVTEQSAGHAHRFFVGK